MSRGLGVGPRLRDTTTAVLAAYGIEYRPSSGDTDWLWCLGGPDLFRVPSQEHIEQNMCVDLHIAVCEVHQAVDTRIEGVDIIPSSGGGTGPDDPRRARPVSLGYAVDEVIDAFEARLRRWLPEVLAVDPR